MKRNKGITLIALVITIIVLLILAGITINMVLGENGIMKQAQEAGDKNEEKVFEELIRLAIINSKTNEEYEIKLDKLEEDLLKINNVRISKAEENKLPWTVTQGKYSYKINDDGTVSSTITIPSNMPIYAEEIEFIPENLEWDVNNVKDAIDSLYIMYGM